MALLFMDGFGGADSTYKWDLTSSTYLVATASPRVSGGIYGDCGTVKAFSKTISASARVFIGIGIRTNTGSYISFYGDNGVTQHITVARNITNGLLEIRRGNNAGTLLASGTQPIFDNQWNYVEISVTISDTIGEVHVRLNGQTTDNVAFTGDTKNAGTATTIDKIYVHSGTGASNVFDMADLYILNNTGTLNNTYLGDVVVRTLAPTGNGTYSQLTGSDGNQTDNYLLVDESPFSSADYVGSATVGQKDMYVMANLPGGVSTVHGVQVNGKMAKTDASLASARYLLRSGGTDYAGTTRALTTTHTGYYEIHELDPATGVAWTPSGVNSAEAGMEVQ